MKNVVYLNFEHSRTIIIQNKIGNKDSSLSVPTAPISQHSSER